MDDLEEAIQVAREAVDAAPQDHPDRTAQLNNLGIRLGDRYSRTGAMDDLEEAIQVAREAVDATGQDHPDRAGRLNNLGIQLGNRYSRAGAMDDLNEAISCYQSAPHQLNSTILTRIKAGMRSRLPRAQIDTKFTRKF